MSTAIEDEVALARLLTRADEFLTFLDEHWYAALPRFEDTEYIISTKRTTAIMKLFDNERKKLARGGMGKTKRVKVLAPSDVLAMIDAFKDILYVTYFNATMLLSRDINYSYEVKIRRTLQLGPAT